MLEMADAYATLANGGYARPADDHRARSCSPTAARSTSAIRRTRRVFSSGETYAATKVLETVIQSGTGTAANYGCPAAGKTGTANNYDNAWFVGYTPQLSTAVWVGYPQGNITMANGFGGTLAAPIWHDYMAQASNGFCGDFPPPTTYWTGTAFIGAALGERSRRRPAGNGSVEPGTTTRRCSRSRHSRAAPPTGGGAPSPTTTAPHSGAGSGNGGDRGRRAAAGGGNGNGNGGGGPKKH